jgi:hypothetical protein
LSLLPLVVVHLKQAMHSVVKGIAFYNFIRPAIPSSSVIYREEPNFTVSIALPVI